MKMQRSCKNTKYSDHGASNPRVLNDLIFVKRLGKYYQFGFKNAKKKKPNLITAEKHKKA